MKYDKSQDNPVTYTALIEYQVAEQTHSIKDDVPSNPTHHAIGEKVTVRYDLTDLKLRGWTVCYFGYSR